MSDNKALDLHGKHADAAGAAIDLPRVLRSDGEMLRPAMNIRAEVAGALTFVLLALGVALVLSYWGVVPAITGYVGTFHPHIGIVLGVIAVGFYMLGATLRARISLAAAILIIGVSSVAIVQLRGEPGAAPDPASPVLTIGSFNILGDNLEHGATIAALIEASSNDVFVVMEAQPIAPYLDDIAKTYPYRAGCPDAARCDLVVFSRLPLQSVDILSAGPTFANRVIRLRLEKSGAVLTYIAAHITKPFLDERGYDELWWLTRLLRQQTGPVIVSGDFNQSSWSPMLNAFLKRTGLTTATFEPATWPSGIGDSGIPIDHVFARGGAMVTSVTAIIDPMGSNHRGLEARVALPSPAPGL